MTWLKQNLIGCKLIYCVHMNNHGKMTTWAMSICYICNYNYFCFCWRFCLDQVQTNRIYTLLKQCNWMFAVWVFALFKLLFIMISNMHFVCVLACVIIIICQLVLLLSICFSPLHVSVIAYWNGVFCMFVYMC